MLEGRGIDFEAIGFAQGTARAFERLEREASRRILASNRAAAQSDAHAAGRDAQLAALYDALVEAAPDHSALTDTGLVWPSGSPALAYELCYSDAYDAVARARGVSLAGRPMTPADQARHQVLAEPITTRSFMLFWTRWHWRGAEYRTRQGAERARAAAAREASANA